MDNTDTSSTARPAIQAFLLWVLFMIVNLLHHGTIAFILGADMSGWIYSRAHLVLSGFLVYGLVFLAVPMILVKGWPTVRQPGFFIPLMLAVVGGSLWSIFRGIAILILVVLVYLHLRYDLSALGIRSSGWRGDAIAILLVSGLYFVPRLLKPIGGMDIEGGLATGASRLFANPATTAEYLFYFGFLASRLSSRLRPVPTAIVVGLMYMLHEMTNPEYWYEGVQFPLIFVGVSVACGIYLWRRALHPIWFGDGLARAISAMLI